MKFFGKKSLSFIFIFLAIAFLGTLIISGLASIYAKTSEDILNNPQFRSIALLFIWFIIPSIVAYYITYRHHSQIAEEKLNKKIETQNALKGILVTFISIIIIVGLFQLMLGPGGFDPYTLTSVTEEQLDNSVPSDKKASQQSVVLDFSALEAENIKPKIDIDVSNWNQFEDKLIKIRFLYPSIWETPQINFSRGETGWSYRVYFSNISFTIGGTSPDFSFGGIGGNFTDFNGFWHQGRKLFLNSIEDFCSLENLVSCQILDKKVFATSGISCDHSTWGSGMRMLFLDRPGEQISGLAFGGPFLSTAYTSITQALCQVDDQNTKERFNKLIKERRLDSESIKKLDTIDKVFETLKFL